MAKEKMKKLTIMNTLSSKSKSQKFLIFLVLLFAFNALMGFLRYTDLYKFFIPSWVTDFVLERRTNERLEWQDTWELELHKKLHPHHSPSK